MNTASRSDSSRGGDRATGGRTALRAVKLVVISVAAVLAGCASGPLGGPGDQSRTITAHFENANGLYTGNAVSVLGMRIGKVVSIQAHGSYVEVTMSIDKPTKIPADVQAVTISDSVLTDRHVELTPVYRNGPTLPDHAVLPIDRTKTPVEFESLLSMADKLAKSLGGDGAGNGPIADLMQVGSAMTVGNGNAMRDALTELSRALQLSGDDGAATKDAITKVVTNLDTLTTIAARNDQTLRQFGSGIGQLSDLLAELNLGKGDTGAKLNEIIVAVADLLQRNQQNLTTLASGSNTMTKSMADYNDNLAEFLDVFPLVTDNAYNAIDPDVGALRATVDLNRLLLDGQMLKEVCNLLGLKQLGCATGTKADMGPDFGIAAMLEAMAGLPPVK
ncbi:MCE family protein [Nocardia sp. NBC_00565]|uniref:MCE family protein n=1 Tax=Nocardia sp. NBC_00565 TaxID=2975993 RepID=UPI002E8065C0|nr:MCE family protein [Nocardia sp. NBC_00565]WUC05853.1 MCE family protein [Nocardia sp. NBC_00565]